MPGDAGRWSARGGRAETDAFWRRFLRSLRARGRDGVQLVISDAHTGLVAAIAKVVGCQWRRCTVQFLRDLLGHLARAQQPLGSGRSARSSPRAQPPRRASDLGGLSTSSAPCPKVARLLEDAEADRLAC
jgi:transposase-like protein